MGSLLPATPLRGVAGVACEAGGSEAGPSPCKGGPPRSLVATGHGPGPHAVSPGLLGRGPCPPRLPISASLPLSRRDVHGNQKRHHGERRLCPRGEPQRPGGHARDGPGGGGGGGGLGTPEPAPALPALRRYQAGASPWPACVGWERAFSLFSGHLKAPGGVSPLGVQSGSVHVRMGVHSRGLGPGLPTPAHRSGVGRAASGSEGRTECVVLDAELPLVPTRLAVGSWPHHADPGSLRFVHVT